MSKYVLKVWRAKANINNDAAVRVYFGDDITRLRRMRRLIYKIAPGLVTVLGRKV